MTAGGTVVDYIPEFVSSWAQGTCPDITDLDVNPTACVVLV